MRINALALQKAEALLGVRIWMLGFIGCSFLARGHALFVIASS
jgi:hypothetical protein